MPRLLAKAKIKSENDMRNGEWVVGYFVYLYDHEGHESNRIYTGYAETDCGEFYPDWYEVDPQTVCPYTGKEDRDGKEIFYGDIIQVRNDVLKVVRQAAGLIARKENGRPMTWQSVEIGGKIIGNVFDNPELLESKAARK